MIASSYSYAKLLLMRKVDVAIIGAGTAGLSARREVVKHTSNYVVIEGGETGTICARVGCMPSKIFIEAANNFHKSFLLNQMGFKGSHDLRPHYPEIMKYVRKLRDRFVRSVVNSMEDWEECHLIREKATFLSQNELKVGHDTIEADKIIIATGASPYIPDEWMHARDLLITTDEFFELEDLPKKMAVIGSGVIGLELGQALARLGIDVVMIGKGEALGGLTDPEIVSYARTKFTDEFPFVNTGVSRLDMQNGKLIIITPEKTFEVDKALVAVGRRPNLHDLGLDKIGVDLNQEGAPKVSCRSHNIKGTSIYLAGDVSGVRPVLHEAADEGRIAGYNSVRDQDETFKRRLQLGITFTAPNIAIVGLSHKDLHTMKKDFVSGSVSFEGQGRAIIMHEEKGMLKVYGDRKTGKLLGAEIFCPDGEHIAHLLAWAMESDLTVYEALKKPFYHPVIEEGLRTALRDLSTKVETSLPELELMRCDDPPAGA